MRSPQIIKHGRSLFFNHGGMATPMLPSMPFQGVTYGAYNTPQELFNVQQTVVSPLVHMQVSAACCWQCVYYVVSLA